MKNLEHIVSGNLIRTKLCSEAESVTHGRDLCTHLKLWYFPIFYSRQSTLHASNHMSCFSPFCHIIIVHQSYPSFYPAFQNSLHFPISLLTTTSHQSCPINPALEKENQPKPRFHLKLLPHDNTGDSQPCKSFLDASPT